MSEDEQRRILRLLAIEKEQRRSHKSLRKWATENFATLGHWKRAAEIKERAAENFSVLKSAPAKACSKKCTSGSRVQGRCTKPDLQDLQNCAPGGKERRPEGYLWSMWALQLACAVPPGWSCSDLERWEFQDQRGELGWPCGTLGA